MSARDELMRARETSGCVRASRARSTGSIVIVLDLDRGGEWAGDSSEGGRWMTLCDRHSSLIQHATRRTAESFAAAPEEWCESCAALIEQRAQRDERWIELDETMIERADAERYEDEGYEPIHVESLREGDVVRICDTDPLYGNPLPRTERDVRVRSVRIESDEIGILGVAVEHSQGELIADELDVAWLRVS